MKTIIAVLAGLALLASFAPIEAQAQTDPGYSTSNYKHANKAAAARRWEGKAGVRVQAPAPQNAQVTSYKNQLPNQRAVGGVTVPHVPNEELANRNYKAQPVQTTQSADELARRRAKKQRTDSAIGD